MQEKGPFVATDAVQRRLQDMNNNGFNQSRHNIAMADVRGALQQINFGLLQAIGTLHKRLQRPGTATPGLVNFMDAIWVAPSSDVDPKDARVSRPYWATGIKLHGDRELVLAGWEHGGDLFRHPIAELDGHSLVAIYEDLILQTAKK